MSARAVGGVVLLGATLLGCGGLKCKTEDAVIAAERETRLDDEKAVVRATNEKMRETGATRLDIKPVALSSICYAAGHPNEERDEMTGWREPIPIRCEDLRMFVNQAKPFEAVTASGVRVVLIRAEIEGNAIAVGTTRDGRTLFFRAVRYPDRMHDRTVTQCGACSGLSDGWAREKPETTTIAAFVVEGRELRTTSAVEFPYEGYTFHSHCQERVDE